MSMGPYAAGWVRQPPDLKLMAMSKPEMDVQLHAKSDDMASVLKQVHHV